MQTELLNNADTLIPLDSPLYSPVKIKTGLLLAVVIALAFISALSWYFYQQDRIHFVDSVKYKSPAKLEVISNDLSLKILNVIQDVQLLAKVHEVLFAERESLSLADSEKIMLEMARVNPRYSQIRLISPDGQEQARVERVDSDVITIEANRLQNKAQRYYFVEGIGLARDQVYISPIDLNIEFGEVVEPYQPIMRFISPIYNQAGKMLAIAAINYDANALLSALKKYSNEQVDLMLLNNQGFWLKSQNRDDEWGFMFPDKQTLTFGQRQPLIWEKVSKNSSGTLPHEDGVFMFDTIHFKDIRMDAAIASNLFLGKNFAEQNTWKIISFLSHQKINDSLFSMQVRYLLTVLLIWVLVISTGLFFYRWILYRAKHHQALLEHAYYDELTGAMNRTSFVKHAEQYYQQQQDFSLIYIDLDGFKPLNDLHGHHAGDVALQIVVKRIQHLLRENDEVFRMGGDEFVVLLHGRQEINALETIQNRIGSEVERNMNIEGKSLSLGLSSGLAQSHSHHSIRELLNAADTSMYLEKNRKRAANMEPWLV